MIGRRYIVVIVLIMILNGIPNEADTTKTIVKTPFIVIYGYSGCPACSGLKKFFDANRIPYVFKEVYNCGLQGCKATDYGRDLAKILKIANLEPFIPVSIVINREGRIVAIVQGYVNDINFWRNLLNKKFNNTINVYVNVSLNNTITDPNSISELEEIVFRDIATVTVRNNTSDGTWQFIIIGITFVIISIVSSAIMIYRRKRAK